MDNNVLIKNNKKNQINKDNTFNRLYKLQLLFKKE